MIDQHLVRFYNAVKAPEWDKIESYKDLYTLPSSVLTELHEVNNLDQVINDSISFQGIVNHAVGPHARFNIGFKKNNFIFVIINKCASSFYYRTFTKQFIGWDEINLFDYKLSDYTCVGVMLHPLIRRIKGITEALLEAHAHNADLVLSHLDDPSFSKFVEVVSIGEIHSFPYHTQLGEQLQHIDFIPLCLDNEQVYNLLNKKLETAGLTERFSANMKLHHVSNDKEKLIQARLISLYYHANKCEYILPYSDDLAYYYGLIDQYKHLVQS